MKRFFAVVLAAALVVLSPGLPCYEALAANVKTTSGNSGSTGNGQAGSNQTGTLNNSVSPVTLTPASLTGSLELNQSGAPQVLPNAIVANVPANLVAPVANPAVNNPALITNALTAPIKQTVVAPSSKDNDNVPPALQPGSNDANSQGGSLNTGKTTINAVSNSAPIKELGNNKGDKNKALSWLFDRSKNKAGADSVVSAQDALSSGNKSKLLPSGPNTPSEPNQVPSPKSENAKPGLLKRIRTNFNLSDFNESEKSYIKGQAIFLLAISVYLASLPLLVKALTGDAAMTGVARMVHYWVFGGASLFAGAIVDKTPMKRILVGAAGTRALIFGTIGVLGLMGGLPWVGFLALVGVNSLIVSMNHLVDIDTGGAAKVFSSDKKIEKAGYVYDFIYYGMMLVIPPLIGIPMDWLDGRFGPGLGAAAGFAVFATLMAVTSTIYAKKVKIIGETIIPAALKGVRDAIGRVWSSIKTFGRIVREMPGRNWRTLKLIYNNKAILARSTMATMENFVEDALFAVVLPTFAIDVLKVGAFGNGMLLSAITAGGLLASTILMSRAQKIQKKIGTYKFLVFLTAGASLAFLPSIGLWAVPSLWMAVPAVMLMKFMYQPLRSRMRALLQTAIKNDPAASKASADIYSLMTFFEVIAAGAGGLAFSWLFMHSGAGSGVANVLGASAPMKVVTMALVGVSLVYLLGLKWVKKQLATPIRKVHNAPEGKEAEAMTKLAANLERMGLPAYKTRVEKGPAPKGAPTVAVMSPASVYKLSIAREGARQSETGDFHLVLDPSWVTQEIWTDKGSKLVLKKGLVFDKDGQATIVEYETPRPLHYFANFYTMGANDRDDGVPLEKDLDIPMSNSVQLEKVTNDKLLTRLLLAAKGVGVPATIAFLMASHPLNAKASELSGEAAGVQIAAMPQGESEKAEIRGSIEQFLRHYQGAEVVVKPSGPQFHSGRGVKFFPRADVGAMVEHVLALRADAQMTPDGAVLVDGRLTPPALYLATGKGESKGFLSSMIPVHFLAKSEIATANPKERKDWNLRVLAARTPWNGAVTTGIFARAGAWGVPTTAEPANPEDAASMVFLDDVISALKKQHGLLQTPAEEAEFRAALDDMGAKALLALAENEAKRQREDGEAKQGQTDYIGLDVMVEVENGKLVPKVIEVNDHDAGGQWQLDLDKPQTAGAHSREWVATMLQRARRDLIKGKRIVIVGAGYEGKRFIFERAKELGIKVVLIDKGLSGWAKFKDRVRVALGRKSQDHWARGLVDEFINTDNSKPIEALASAREKLLRSARKNGEIEGITTFWEDDVPLTADLAKALSLPYHTQDAAKSVRSKAETRRVMKEAGLPTPRFTKIAIKPDPDAAALKAAREDLASALKYVSFPAVLKPAFGAAAMGVKRVENAAEAQAAFDEMLKVFGNDPIFKQGWDMVLEQYLEGPEYDVDIVMQGGKARFASVTDNWPTREPYFVATGSSLPSTLAKSKQAEIEDLAIKTAQALGLTDGVVHIEGKYTKEGPRIIEANGRMGGVYVRDWVRAVWGVDLVEENLMAAAGITVGAFKSEKPLTHLEGEFAIPTEKGRIKALQIADQDDPYPARFDSHLMMKVGDEVDGVNGRVAMVVGKGASHAEAQKNLAAERARLILDIDKK